MKQILFTRAETATYVREINQLDPIMPLMIEHLNSDEEYRKAADYIRGVEAAL